MTDQERLSTVLPCTETAVPPDLDGALREAIRIGRVMGVYSPDGGGWVFEYVSTKKGTGLTPVPLRPSDPPTSRAGVRSTPSIGKMSAGAACSRTLWPG